jgi:hypothetical protein
MVREENRRVSERLDIPNPLPPAFRREIVELNAEAERLAHVYSREVGGDEQSQGC